MDTLVLLGAVQYLLRYRISGAAEDVQQPGSALRRESVRGAEQRGTFLQREQPVPGPHLLVLLGFME